MPPWEPHALLRLLRGRAPKPFGAFVVPGARFPEGLAPEERKEVEAICPPRRLFRGEAVFRQGDEAESLYILVEGRVRLLLETPKGDRTLALLGPGDLFGESFLTDRPRQGVTALVQSPEAVVCPVSRDQFLALCRHVPEAALRLCAVLAERVTLLSEELAEATLPAPVRVGRLLLSLCRRFGDSHGDGGVRLDVGLTQEELGSLCGVSRVSVAYALRLFRMEGALQREGAGYLVYPARLEGLLQRLIF
ncbi:Crp/Fnr family transcriptional regulator [Thermus sp. FJN-A]